MASGAGATISLRAAQDVVMFPEQPTTSLFSKSMADVYTDYGYALTEIPPDGNSGVFQANTDLKFDPTGLGDSILSLYLFAALPALDTNGGSDAYYCQSAGYAMINEIKLKNGTQEMLKHNNYHLYHFYQTRSPYAQDRIDANIFRYEMESQLISQSSTNSMINVPILFCCSRPDRPDNSFPLTTFYHSTIRFVIRFNSLDQWTVNPGAISNIPYLYGTTQVLTGNDINVAVYACIHLLDDAERLALANSNYFRLWYTMDDLQQDDTTTAGKVINVQQTSFNGPTRAFMIGFLPDSFVDGSTRSPNGVGLKNFFDFSAPHGGESLYAVQMKINNSEILDATVPSTLLREQRWRECYDTPAYTMLYLIPYQPHLSQDVSIHTINPSAIDKLTFQVTKNHSASGTLIILQDKVTCVVADEGVGGVPYQ